MDSTIGFDQLKTLIAFAECGVKRKLLRLPEHLQPMIDKPELMQRFVRWAEAGMPEFRANQPAPVVVFEDPESHCAARAIMGKRHFHGIAAAQKHFGAYTEAALQQHSKICLFDEKKKEFLTEEDTLAILEKHKKTHILVATHEIDIVSVHARYADRFSNDPKPWFAKVPEKEWASKTITVPWLLVRRDVVHESWSKDVDTQKQHVADTLPNERLTLPAEHCYSALLHFLETGEKLCSGYWVRFFVQGAGGGWVGVGWGGDRLRVGGWGRVAGGSLASGSVWASR